MYKRNRMCEMSIFNIESLSIFNLINSFLVWQHIFPQPVFSLSGTDVLLPYPGLSGSDWLVAGCLQKLKKAAPSGSRPLSLPPQLSESHRQNTRVKNCPGRGYITIISTDFHNRQDQELNDHSLLPAYFMAGLKNWTHMGTAWLKCVKVRSDDLQNMQITHGWV